MYGGAYLPRGGAHISMGDLTEGFLRYKVGRLIFEGLISGILRYINNDKKFTSVYI